ncbi:hypothetical protein [Cryobacterium sp. TMS1-20-1]|uniref:hypothetical protein n=1 Tax=Cryobacterium sp. TMS1-20-1 TaxID=1259223 RepID=UPI00141A9763|nr:hypothetical protein [Cryobacterium sp. TMS1-20-1]
MKKSGANHNVEFATIADLARTHKRLLQDSYYAGDSLRLTQVSVLSGLDIHAVP